MVQVISHLIGGIIGAATGALIIAFVVQLATYITMKFKLTYRMAYKVAFLWYAPSGIIILGIKSIVGTLANQMFGVVLLLTTVISVFLFFPAYLYGILIKHPEKGAVGFRKGLLISTIQLLILGIIIVLIAGIVAIMT